MKLKTLFLSTILAVLPWPLSAQSSEKVNMSDVMKNIDMDGQFFMANNIEGDLGKLANLITDYSNTTKSKGKRRKSCLPAGIDLNVVLQDCGLDKLVAYGRSAKFAGDHWVSKLYLYNNGSKEGVFSMMGEGNSEYKGINFAPSGSDLALEWNIDTRKLMASVKNVPKCPKMNKLLSRRMPKGGTMQDLLNRFTAKISIVVKLDDKKKKVCPLHPEFIFPKIHGCLRMKGANHIWKQIGGMAGFMMKLDNQADGTLLMTPHKKKKNMDLVMLMDIKNDVLWAATSPEFLAECRSNGPKLVNDKNYNLISGGSKTGNGHAYISKRACLELRQVKEAKYKKRGKNYVSDGMLKKIMDHLTESKNGYYAEIRKSENGINMVLKAPCPVKEIIGGKCFRKKGCGYRKNRSKGYKKGCPKKGGCCSKVIPSIKAGCGCDRGKCKCKNNCKCKKVTPKKTPEPDFSEYDNWGPMSK